MESLKENLINISNFLENDFKESKHSNKLLDLLNSSSKNMLNFIEKYKIFEEEEKLKEEQKKLEEEIKIKQKELNEKKQKLKVNAWSSNKNDPKNNDKLQINNEKLEKNNVEPQKNNDTYNPNKKLYCSILTCGHQSKNDKYCPFYRINVGNVENFYPNKSLKDLINHCQENHDGKNMVDILLYNDDEFNYNKLNYEKNKEKEGEYFLKLKGENFSHYLNYSDLCNLLKNFTAADNNTLVFYQKFFQ